jgi:hypothetical protein
MLSHRIVGEVYNHVSENKCLYIQGRSDQRSAVLVLPSRKEAGSSVSIAAGYRLDGRGVGIRVPVVSRISPCRPDRLGSLSNLLSNGYRGLFLRG